MLTFQAQSILQTTAAGEKNWSLTELLEQPNPLAGEPLAERNQAMRQVVDMALDYYADLSESALLRYDFWKQLIPQRIEYQQFEYAIQSGETFQWQLTVNPEGLFYKDISGEYSANAGAVYEQLFSDFWFYGPLMPLPHLHTRKMVVAKIRNAFMQAGSPASYKHFPFFEYPVQPDGSKQWIMGDQQASEFVTLRDYGIETGRSNWHDGLVNLQYLSFENFMQMPERPHLILTDSICAEIRAFIQETIEAQVAKAALPREADRDETDPPVTTSRFDELAPFIETLKTDTQKSMEEWFELIRGSQKTKFLEVRKWLQDKYQLDTKTATNLAMLYDQHLEDVTPVIWVYTQGRGGTIGYKGPEGAFDTEWEFGGGDSLAIIFLPTKENWFVQTGIPTVHRDKVLQIFGQLVVERQTQGKGSFELQDNCMVIFK